MADFLLLESGGGDQLQLETPVTDFLLLESSEVVGQPTDKRWHSIPHLGGVRRFAVRCLIWLCAFGLIWLCGQ